MSGEELSAEQKIVLAAIECIERQGIHRVTIRGIAKEAGVNSAAINYYFRSKEKLVATAMETTLGHLAEDLRAIASDRSRPLADRLGDLLEYFIEGAIRYPRVTRAHLYEPFLEGTSESHFGRLLAEILGVLDADLAAEQAGQTGRRLALVQLFSAALLPALMPTLFRGFGGIDFRDLRTRRSYIEGLVRGLLERG